MKHIVKFADDLIKALEDHYTFNRYDLICKLTKVAKRATNFGGCPLTGIFDIRPDEYHVDGIFNTNTTYDEMDHISLTDSRGNGLEIYLSIYSNELLSKSNVELIRKTFEDNLMVYKKEWYKFEKDQLIEHLLLKRHKENWHCHEGIYNAEEIRKKISKLKKDEYSFEEVSQMYNEMQEEIKEESEILRKLRGPEFDAIPF